MEEIDITRLDKLLAHFSNASEEEAAVAFKLFRKELAEQGLQAHHLRLVLDKEAKERDGGRRSADEAVRHWNQFQNLVKPTSMKEMEGKLAKANAKVDMLAAALKAERKENASLRRKGKKTSPGERKEKSHRPRPKSAEPDLFQAAE
jgi:hypothetical protein